VFRAALLALLLPTVASAHDFWAEPVGGTFLFRYGDRGGEVLPLEAAKVKGVRCAAGVGPAVELRARAVPADRALRLGERCGAVSAFLHGGFYSLTPDGEVNRAKDEVPDAVRSWESRQFAKWIDPADPAATRPLGDALEIVPVTDLRRVHAGDKATFRVLLDGQPVPGATFSVGHKALAETDRSGEARIRVRAAEVESVSASLRRPLASPKADALVLEATLTFPVAR
jgi:hypothetical protein